MHATSAFSLSTSSLLFRFDLQRPLGLSEMENSSLPSHVYQTFIASNNGTVNNSCCASSEMDYTTYCKVALIFLCMITTAVISGFAATARAIRSLSQGPQDDGSHVSHSHSLDVEAQPPTRPLDEYNTREMAHEGGLPRKAVRAAEQSDGFGGDTSDPSPQQASTPPSWERRGRRILSTMQTAATIGGWATQAINALAVTVSCVLSGPPSLQYNLPSPVTESGRPNRTVN